MDLTSVKKIIEPMPATDGAGVKLKRAIGTPELDYLDPFLMLDEFGSDNAEDYIAGFPPHPHRGIETVTYMLKGEFEHQDSTGAKGNMKSGDVQWMKTGRGIIHSEMPAMSEGKLQGFQLWINMPAELKKNKEFTYTASLRNSSLQIGYFLKAVNALGLDAACMSGFINDAVDNEFFKDTSLKSNILCNIGFGEDPKGAPRGPRYNFDEVAEII